MINTRWPSLWMGCEGKLHPFSLYSVSISLSLLFNAQGIRQLPPQQIGKAAYCLTTGGHPAWSSLATFEIGIPIRKPASMVILHYWCSLRRVIENKRKIYKLILLAMIMTTGGQPAWSHIVNLTIPVIHHRRGYSLVLSCCDWFNQTLHVLDYIRSLGNLHPSSWK